MMLWQESALRQLWKIAASSAASVASDKLNHSPESSNAATSVLLQQPSGSIPESRRLISTPQLENADTADSVSACVQASSPPTDAVTDEVATSSRLILPTECGMSDTESKSSSIASSIQERHAVPPETSFQGEETLVEMAAEQQTKSRLESLVSSMTTLISARITDFLFPHSSCNSFPVIARKVFHMWCIEPAVLDQIPWRAQKIIREALRSILALC